MVWDVLSASPVARLDDLSSARELLKEYTTKTASSENPLAAGTANNSVTSNAAAAGVASLAWVLPSAKLLAVVVSPALLLLWDVAGESPSGGDMLTSIAWQHVVYNAAYCCSPAFMLDSISFQTLDPAVLPPCPQAVAPMLQGVLLFGAVS